MSVPASETPRCAGCGLLFFEASGPRPEFYDREGHAYCSYNCGLRAAAEGKLSMHICSRCHQAYSLDQEPDCPHLYRTNLSTRRKVGEREIIRELVEAALLTDGAHHKQWYLERLAVQFEIPTPDHEPGVAP